MLTGKGGGHMVLREDKVEAGNFRLKTEEDAMRRALFVAALVSLGVSACWAQDPVKVDPQHYKVELENAQVRVLRIHYGPHEKSVMHYHPNLVAVFLTDGQIKMTDASGKTEDMQ